MPPSQFVQPFRLTKNRKLSEHFYLLEGVSVWHPELKFQPGQYLMTDAVIDGNYLRRSYSPFKTESGDIGLLIKRNPNGVFSSNLVSHQVDDVVRISAPVGKEKIFKGNIQPVYVFAFDSGISFVKNLTSWGVENISHIFWLDSSADHDKKSIIEALTIEQPIESFYDWIHFAKRIKDINFRDSRIYLAGNGQYINFFNDYFRTIGISESNIHREIYYNHKSEYPHDWKSGLS